MYIPMRAPAIHISPAQAPGARVYRSHVTLHQLYTYTDHSRVYQSRVNHACTDSSTRLTYHHGRMCRVSWSPLAWCRGHLAYMLTLCAQTAVASHKAAGLVVAVTYS